MKSLTILLGLLLGSYTVSFAQNPVILSDKALGGTGVDQCNAAIKTGDGGYILGGTSTGGVNGDKSEPSMGGFDFWVIKIDASGNKVWDKTFGGSDQDQLYTIVKTMDGGYLLAGTSRSGVSAHKSEPSRGIVDYWVIKIDANGNKLWDKTLGTDNWETFGGAVEMADGSYLITGHTEGSNTGDRSEPSRGSSDLWVVKLSPIGNIVWEKVVGGSWADYIYGVVANPDGYVYLAAGSSSPISFDRTSTPIGSYDLWLVKMDISGNIAWDRSYGGTWDDFPRSIACAANGDLLIGGYSNSPPSGTKTSSAYGNEDFWLVRINTSGTQLWEKSFGTAQGEWPATIGETSEGYIVASGYSPHPASGDKSQNSFGTNDFWMIATTAGGTKIWDKTLGGNGDDLPTAIVPDATGGFMLAGTSSSSASGTKTAAPKGSNDFWYVLMDIDNNPLPDLKPASLFAGGSTGLQDGTGASAKFRGPQALAHKNGDGSVFVADAFNHCIRKISSAGVVTTLVGNGTKGYVDGFGTAAQLNYPMGLAYDQSAGMLYIADYGNNSIRKLNVATGELTTLVGQPTPGLANGDYASARFKNPTGLTLIGSYLYVADNGNHCIRKIDLVTKTVFTLAGNGSPGYGEGTGASAKFNSPWHLTNDGGSIYVTDRNNHRIRKVSAEGTTSVEVGSGTPGYSDGSNLSCKLNQPTGIHMEGGMLVFTDHNNRCLRRVQSGVVVTLSGNGTPGTAVGATSRYCGPAGITGNGAGKFYILDSSLQQVRVVQ